MALHCDLCMRGTTRRGRDRCAYNCPLRRGLTRIDVTAMLHTGQSVWGLSPRSPLLSEVRADIDKKCVEGFQRRAALALEVARLNKRRSDLMAELMDINNQLWNLGGFQDAEQAEASRICHLAEEIRQMQYNPNPTQLPRPLPPGQPESES